ncbi:MAG: carbamoyltransferase, partial [Candidatus Methylomirabilis sp.]|nr:carbamoyltransferase [Deltaproteobacteria bacterium]
EDGTARVHTVERDANPRYYALIEAFERRTGVPAVLDTSLNVRDEPIVMRPAEALACLKATAMDALAIGDFLVLKRPG